MRIFLRLLLPQGEDYVFLPAQMENAIKKEDVLKKRLTRGFGVLLFFAILHGALTPQIVLAANDDQEARIKSLEAAVRALQAELAVLKAERATETHRFEAGGVADRKELEEVVSKVLDEQKADLEQRPDWVNNFSFFGDFRYRHDSMDYQNAVKNGETLDKRERDRIRARLGVKAIVNEEWDAVFRIASGSSDTPISTNQTLGDSDSDLFGTKKLWLDWAYASWHPDSKPGFNLYMGKMPNPFYRVAKNELIFDGDVSPDGIAASYSCSLDDAVTAYVNAGGLWIRERPNDADTSLFGIQGYLRKDFEDSHLLAGASMYDLGNIENQSKLTNQPGHDERPLAGNTPTDADPDVYRYDYNLVELFAEYGFTSGGTPVTLYGDIVQNTAAPNNKNRGWLAGFAINKLKAPGDLVFEYNYRDLESDAAFAGLTSSDFADGGTNASGHILRAKYQLAENLQSILSYYHQDRHTVRKEKFKNIQLDLIFKF